MKAKQFAHFLSFWQRSHGARPARPAARDPRVALAKAALRTCLTGGAPAR